MMSHAQPHKLLIIWVNVSSQPCMMSISGAEQFVAVSEEITCSVVTINDLANETSDVALQTTEAG